MKNIQAQYQDLLEGKMSKSNFMRNVRMQFPQHISSVNSYDDSVKILKGKRILSETKIEELSPATRRAAYDMAQDLGMNIDRGKDSLGFSKRARQSSVFGYRVDPAMKKELDSLFSDTEYTVNVIKSPDEITIKLFGANNKVAEVVVKKGEYKVKQLDIKDEGAINKLYTAIKDIQKSGELGESLNEAFSDFSNNELASYIGTLKSEIHGEKDPKKAELIQRDLEDVKAELEQRRKAREKGLNEAKQPIGVYGHNPNAENDLYRGIDHLNYYQVYKGIQFELAKMPEITDANYIKAREKVVGNIMKDPDAYKDLQLANFKAVKEMDEDLKMKDVKKNNLKDKPNEMKVVQKDAKGNTQATLEKKEKRKSKTAKVPVMTQAPKGKLEAMATPGKEKVMALKEHILDELMKPNEMREDINKGSRVKKKGLKDYDAAQVGNVIEFDGDTAIVIWDKDSKAYEKAKAEWNTSGEGEDPDVTFGHHIQANVLTKKGIPEDPEAAKAFGSLPNIGSVKGPDTGVSPKLTQMQEVDKEESKEGNHGDRNNKSTKESKLKTLKEKLLNAIQEIGFVTKSKKGGVTVNAGRDRTKGIQAAKGLEKQTGTQMVVVDPETGIEQDV